MTAPHPAASEAQRHQQAGYYVFGVAMTLDARGKKDVQFPQPSWQAASTYETRELDRIHATGAYGIDCEKSGIVGVDLDSHGGPDGLALWRDRGLPVSPMRVRTQSGGQHHYFRAKPGQVMATQALGMLGVDVRATGGLLFGAGSVVAGGGGYGWDEGSALIASDQLPFAPYAALDELIAENKRLKAERAREIRPSSFEPVSGTEVQQCEQLAAQQLATVEASVEGGYNDELNRYCYWAGRLFATKVAAGELPMASALDAAEEYVLEQMAASPVLWDERTPADIQTITRSSGIRRGLTEPFAPAHVSPDPGSLAPPDFSGSAEFRDHGNTADHAGELGIHPMVQARLTQLKVNAEAGQIWDRERFPYAARIESRGFASAAELYLRAKDAPREFLVEGWLYRGSYGALGAEYKAGKTWLMMDLALSMAADALFLGSIPVSGGKVAIMHSEGDLAEFFARMDAVAVSKGIELTPEVLARIHVQDGSSVMSDPLAVSKLYDDLVGFSPDLLIIDPWYLSAGEEADGKTLSRVGMVLRNLQGVANELGSALLITTHWNKSGEGNGFSRWSGAGLQEWGRVLVNVGVRKQTTAQPYITDKTGRTEAVLDIELRGQTSGKYTVTRTVWSEDARRANAALHYQVAAEEVGGAPLEPGTDPTWELREKVLRALARAEADRRTPINIEALWEIAGLSRGRQTARGKTALEQLIALEYVVSTDTMKKSGSRKIYVYALTNEGREYALETPDLDPGKLVAGDQK